MQLPPYGPVLASRPREQFSGADPTERQEVSPHCPRPRSGHAGRHRKHCEHQHTQHGRAAGAHALHSGACVLAAGADSEKMSLISAEVAIPRRLSAGAGPSQAPTRGFTRRAAPAGVCGPEADPHLVLGLVAALLPLPCNHPLSGLESDKAHLYLQQRCRLPVQIAEVAKHLFLRTILALFQKYTCFPSQI